MILYLGVGNAWGGTGATFNKPYFFYYNDAGWSKCMVLYGREWNSEYDGYTPGHYTKSCNLALVTNTEKLYYAYIDDYWNDSYNEIAVVEAADWGDARQKIGDRWGSVNHTYNIIQNYSIDYWHTYYWAGWEASTLTHCSTGAVEIPKFTTTLNIKVRSSVSSSYSNGSTSNKPASTIKLTGSWISDDHRSAAVRDDAEWTSSSYCSYESVISGAVTASYSSLGSGWIFDGWYISSTQVGTGTSYDFYQTANTTIEARFTQAYTVTYNGNGNTGGSVPAVSGTKYSSGSNVTLATNTGSLTKTGYALVGWNTANDGTGTHYDLGGTLSTISANQTLYAEWIQVHSPGTYTGTYGKSLKMASCYQYEWYSISKNSSSGWFILAGEQSSTTNGSAANVAMTLPGTKTYKNAGWFTVKYEGNDGNASPARDNEFGDLLSSSAPNIKIKTTDQALIMAVSGYEQFSFVAKDNNSDKSKNKYIKVVIDGVDVTGTAANSWTVRRHSITSGATHIIELRGTGNEGCQLAGFSLKLPNTYPAPSALAASSITSGGATLTVTDSYSTDDYEFYVSISSTTPAANADASYTSTSTTKVISDLSAGTPYYAWVRSKCSNDRKSAWVALTGSTFTTSAGYTVTLNNQSATTAGTTSVSLAVGDTPSDITCPEKTGYNFAGYYTNTRGGGTQIIDANGSFNSDVTGYTDEDGKWEYEDDVTLYAWWKNTCSASAYTFRYYNSGTTAYESECFSQVGSTHEWNVSNFTIPSETKYYVGYNEDFWSSGLGTGDTKSASAEQTWTTAYAQVSSIGNGAMQFLPSGVNSAVGQATGAVGTLVIWDNSADKNLSVGFLPSGYGVTTADDTYAFTIGDGYFCYTDPVTISSTEAAGTFQVKLATSSSYVACAHGTAESAATVSGRKISGDADIASDKKGVFQMWQNSSTNNFGLRFVTVYDVSFNMQGHGDDISDYTNVRYNDKISAPTAPTADGYTFGGWYKESACTNAWDFANDVVTEATTLFAKWTFNASTSINIEQAVLDNGTGYNYKSALTSANITYSLSSTASKCSLDSLSATCGKTDRNNNYLGLKLKESGQYVQINLPSGKTLKVRFGYRGAAVNLWIDGVAQTDIPTTSTYYTYELASSASNRVVKIATSSGDAVVIKQIMINESIASVTLPAKITLGGTTNGTISVASTKVDVGSTVTVTVTPSSGYELSTLTYTPVCPAASDPVAINTSTKQFTMPNRNVTINATFVVSCSAPAAPSISGTTTYTTGETMTLTASCASGADASTTYTWYKGADWATAYAAGAVQAAKTSAAGGTTYSKTFAVSDAGTYWCEAANSSCKSHNSVGYTISAQTYTVTYEYNGATGGNGTASATAASITLPTPTKTSNTFDGWYVGATHIGDGGNTYYPTADVTAYAKWKETCAGGGGGGTLFEQDFDDATELAYDAPSTTTPKTYSYTTANPLSGLVGSGADLFTTLKTSTKKSDIAVNSSTGGNGRDVTGKFQCYGATENANLWALVRTANFASTAPTAIKFEMDILLEDIATSKQEIEILVGSGFSDDSYARPAYTAAYTGFDIISNGTAGKAHSICKVGSTTKIGTENCITNNTEVHLTWVINNTGSSITYKDPNNTDETVATGSWDLWVGTTRVVNEQARGTSGSTTFTGTTLQNLYIGNNMSTKHDVVIDNIVVTDLTPGSSCYYVTYDGNGANGGFTNDPTAYTSSNTVTVEDNSFTKTNYAFVGWNTKSDGSGTTMQPDGTFTITKDTTLYAQWKAIKYFKGTSNSNWNTAANWTPSGVPAITDPVVIQHDVTVDINNAKALMVDIEAGNTLTVNAGKALIIERTLTKAGGATAAADVIINSTRAAGTGALIIGSHDGTNAATVNFETKVKRESGTGNWINQFIGSPFSDCVPYVDYALQLYKFVPQANGDRGWWSTVTSGSTMTPFWGYNVLYNDNSELTLNWTGTLNASTSKTISGASMYFSSDPTDNMFANSWPAPIHVGSIEDADIVNAQKTLYIFNAGTPQQESATSITNSNRTAGTYVSIPIHSAPYAGIGVIPAMQAFYVLSTSSGASITLDYNKIVYTPALTDVGITPTRAPKRVEEETPEVITLRVQGENGWAADAYVLGRADFSDSYEDGWDGMFIEGEGATPKLYSMSSDGAMMVNCVPNIEGTVMAFRKGSADNNYTFTFKYDGDEVWYLNDQKEQTSTLISNETSYPFVSASGDNAARFVISKTSYNAPAITTGVDNVQGDDVQSTKVRKVIYKDKLYIIRGGKIYSADGALVK